MCIFFRYWRIERTKFRNCEKYEIFSNPRINERRNVNLIVLMQHLNFGRKYEAAAVAADISRLPSKSCLVRLAQMRDRNLAFLRRRGFNIQLFALRRREHGDIERKTSDVGRKIRERNLL
ncbi:hypothetical protein TNCV_2304121 [Trichonephila clavipes]|nr:hypothetical protein TNCV_2304121 [Trichonephila clavipes]